MEKITYVVIKFDEKTKDGKDSVDLVPVSWTHQNVKGQQFCKYPSNAVEYRSLDRMCRTSLEPKPSWKDFKVSFLKEAGKLLLP